MYHIAFTPNVRPTNALSAKGNTLIGAISNLFRSINLGLDDLDGSYVSTILETVQVAVDNLENDRPAKGSWTDMGCEEVAFSIDIFCADDVRYVKFDDDLLIVPHGAVGLAIGEHNHQEWLYEEPDGGWVDVLLPHVVYQPSEDGLDAAVRSVVNPKITELIRDIKLGDCCLSAIFDDGSERKLFCFYVDELSFSDAELIGKTETEAHHMHQQKTVAYLQS